jgi:hypothetical protein
MKHLKTKRFTYFFRWSDPKWSSEFKCQSPAAAYFDRVLDNLKLAELKGLSLLALSLRQDLDQRPLPYQPQIGHKIQKKSFYKLDYDFWDNFNQFILNHYTHDYAKDVMRQVRQFHPYPASGILSKLKPLPSEKQSRVLKRHIGSGERHWKKRGCLGAITAAFDVLPIIASWPEIKSEFAKEKT